MTETMSLLSAFIGGLLLGGIFFGGLWWTVRKGLASPRPALWFLVSYIVRMAAAATGFYALSGGHWSRLAASLTRLRHRPLFSDEIREENEARTVTGGRSCS